MKPTARSVAWQVLERVERDRAFADLALHGALRETELLRRDRAFATELTYGTLRLRGRLDAALEQVLDRPLRKLEPKLRQLLRLGAYQILGLRDLRPAAVVDESVKLAKDSDLARAKGLVNAVLRELARRAEQGSLVFPEFEKDPAGYLAQWCSLPAWLAERWIAELGPGQDRALAAVCLLARPRTRDPAFEAGQISVQDEASQLIPLLLGAHEGDTVVDCCAAPGSKTVQLAEIVGERGEVIALELHASRLGLIRRGLARTGFENVRVLERDVRQGFDLQGATRYAHILVDAPCSGLGTLRRNPDARWRMRPEDIERVAETGRAILESASRYVARGGTLVYSVCTFTPEETDRLVARFLERQTGFRIDDARPYLPSAAEKLVDASGALRTLPHRDGCDGFFAVRLVRE
jgi:16S rRNA (cytosine967-C5)-methyltransferase